MSLARLIFVPKLLPILIWEVLNLFLLIWFTAEPDVLKEVKQKLDLGSVKFEVLLFFPI